MREYVEEKCKALTGDQRKQLAITVDDIVFLLPEDVSVVFDEEGRFGPVFSDWMQTHQRRLVEHLQSAGHPCVRHKTSPISDLQLSLRLPLQEGSSASSS